ncbi:hypothetical protein [Nocardia bhagyanarayanae]|uniref:RsbT co-antagonist protein RsbRD N-terminal domain-containing protein n=1 Tax=Nocardia bhagyanarayanae TaxID=1215925 RepID=A0A543FG63_9NOCA|nr:hypothetical protein [Nocardia bhagyanarayanae]TQM32752.1 hypothetical protein FB390_4448 [Nocardia bhagyanarayanae]
MGPNDAEDDGMPAPVRDFGTAIRMGLDLALALVEDTDTSLDGMLRTLERHTKRWALDGVPIDEIQHAVHDGVRSGLAQLRDDAGPMLDCVLVVDLLDVMTSAVSRAYVAADRTVRGTAL